MGAASSRYAAASDGPDAAAARAICRVRNDYELAVRASKHLESLLTLEPVSAVGNGLNEKLDHALLAQSVELSDAVVKSVRLVVGFRNRLVHEVAVTCLPDRPKFLAAFASADSALRASRQRRRAASTPHAQATPASCVVM